jgi:hypothetical protein
MGENEGRSEGRNGGSLLVLLSKKPGFPPLLASPLRCWRFREESHHCLMNSGHGGRFQGNAADAQKNISKLTEPPKKKAPVPPWRRRRLSWEHLPRPQLGWINLNRRSVSNWLIFRKRKVAIVQHSSAASSDEAPFRPCPLPINLNGGDRLPCDHPADRASGAGGR